MELNFAIMHGSADETLHVVTPPTPLGQHEMPATTLTGNATMPDYTHVHPVQSSHRIKTAFWNTPHCDEAKAARQRFLAAHGPNAELPRHVSVIKEVRKALVAAEMARWECF